MPSLKLNQIYLWKKESLSTYPWQRQYLNVEFLRYEKKILKEVGEWYNLFINHSTKVGQQLPEVNYYVVRGELDSNWKASIASKGDYNYVALSALKNCHQINLLMLIPKDKRMPTDYSLLRIIKSKKDYIHNKRNNTARYVIIGEEFEEIDPINVYIDVPYEKRIITKFIKENIINDDFIAYSVQPTISSAPYVVNNKGGISLSTFLRKSSFSEEWIRTLKLMQPPEFTDIQFELPPKLLQGNKQQLLAGINFQVAERYTTGKNFFTGVSAYDYKILDLELAKREMFRGEYSIACSLSPRGDNPSELLRDIVSKFVKTEITHPFNTDELKYADVDLSVAQKNIDEDLWIQVANQRQIKPLIRIDSQEVIGLRQVLTPKWEEILDSLGIKKDVEHEAKVYSVASYHNILRVTQSMARDIQKIEVDESTLNKAFRLFRETTEGLINNPEIKYYVKKVIPERYESAKFNAVRAELSINLQDINELYNNLKEFFRDIYELQWYIDKLIAEGCIFEPERGYYKWI